MAIDGLRPEDREVVSGGSLHKCVSARGKKARLSFVPLTVEYTHHSASVACDDFYEAGITVSKAKRFPSVDECNRTPATRNLSPIGK